MDDSLKKTRTESLIEFLYASQAVFYWEIEPIHLHDIAQLSDDRGMPIFGRNDKGSGRPHVLGWLLGHDVLTGDKGIRFVTSVPGKDPIKCNMEEWVNDKKPNSDVAG